MLLSAEALRVGQQLVHRSGAEPERVHLDVVRDAGFEAVEVDPLGFRSGSMNELLVDPERYR